METDVVYFSRRASEERRAERQAVNQLARDYHAQRAAEFEELAAAIARAASHAAIARR